MNISIIKSSMILSLVIFLLGPVYGEPGICTTLWAPVCGCDGVTYRNSCWAAMAGVSVCYGGECVPSSSCSSSATCGTGYFCNKAYGDCNGQGTCEPVPTEECPQTFAPVCGCDGVTYAGECEAAKALTSVAHVTACSPPVCLDNNDCSMFDYCQKADGDCDGSGVCEPIPTACPEIWAPVCGCDNVTYGNDCEAASAGVSMAYTGECVPGSSIADLDDSGDIDYFDFGLFGLDWLADTRYIYKPNEAAWWKFDEGAGATAYDSSVYGHYGYFVNDPDWVTGYDGSGSALSFNGVDEYIEVTGYKGVSGTQSRTCSAWIKTSSSINQAILFWGDMENGTKWKFYLCDYHGAADRNRIQLSVNVGCIVGSTDLIDGQWHHVAAVLEDDGSPDVSEIKLYVDGAEEIYSRVLARPIDTGTSNDVLIGAILGNSGPVLCQFDGEIDDVRIYDYALTDEMIEQLYNGEAPSELICTEYPAADFNYDCIVDIDDLRIFAENWPWSE